MAFDTGGAASGALSGAGAGAGFGPWGAAIGGLAGGLLGGFGGGDEPSSIPYRQLAKLEAENNLALARQNTMANRPDIITPGSTTTWQQGGGFDQEGYDAAMAEYDAEFASRRAKGNTGRNVPEPDRGDYFAGNMDQWTATQELTPEGQKAFESGQRFQTGLSGLGEQAIGAAEGIFDTPYTTPGQVPGYTGPEGELGTFGENRQRVTDAMLSRVDTDIGRDRESKSAELISRGIPIGSEAYNREMEQLDRKQTDARQQAEIAATRQATQEYGADIAGRSQMGREGMADFTTGMDIHKQGVRDALLERSTPLNELSSFRTGSQVSLPALPQYGQQQFVGGPDLTGAAQNAYNQDLAGYNVDQANWNNLMGGLADMGSSYASGWGGGSPAYTGGAGGSYAGGMTSASRPLGWY